jgi:Flp pilus assembly protein TadD
MSNAEVNAVCTNIVRSTGMRRREGKGRYGMWVLFVSLTLVSFGCATDGQRLQPLDVNAKLDAPDRFDGEKALARVPPPVYDRVIEPEPLPEMTAEEHERTGDLLLTRGNLQMAYVHYEKSLRKKENLGIHFKMGIIFVAAQENREAVKEFTKVIEREPDHSGAHQGLGQAYLEMGEFEKAEEHLMKAVALDPKRWKAYNFLGIIHDHQKKHDLAQKEYAAAISIRPRDGMLYNNLAVSFMMTSQYEEAVRALYKALETNFSKEKTYNNLGLALARLGRYENALDAFRRGGDEAKAYNNLGCVYMQAGENGKAIECFEKAIELSPEFYTVAAENLRMAKMAAKRN